MVKKNLFLALFDLGFIVLLNVRLMEINTNKIYFYKSSDAFAKAAAN